MISFSEHGDFSSIEKFLKNNQNKKIVLEKYAQKGVEVLAEATPKRTGLTANSWNYEIEENSRGYKITWTNSNVNEGYPIALLIQYGHGTKNGGYVQGTDYINPAIGEIFEQFIAEIWKEVSS